MSTNQFFRSGLMAAAGIAALGLTACANSHASSARYGGLDHMDYEYNADCAPQGCASGPVYTGYTGSTYTGSTHTTVATPSVPFNVTHMDYEGNHSCYTPTCGASGYSGGFSSGYSSGYSTGITTPTYSTEVANCPAGTTSQPDGTCLQGGSHISSTYTGSSYSGSSYTSGSSYSSYSSGQMADCPAGTTKQPDGTCLQGGSYSSYSSSTTYTAPTTTYVGPALTTTPINRDAPAVVVECCETDTSIYSSGSTTTSSTGYGYATSGTSYGDYMPIRK